MEYLLDEGLTLPYLASIDELGSISTVPKGLILAGLSHWVSMYAQLQPGRDLMPDAQWLSVHAHLVCTAQGQQIHSAPGREAEMPARRRIYSTNKSAHHGGFSGGLHLLGHTCAHDFTGTCSSARSARTGHVQRATQVAHFTSHAIMHIHTCALVHMQVKGLHNEIGPSNPWVFAVPGPCLCRNEG